MRVTFELKTDFAFVQFGQMPYIDVCAFNYPKGKNDRSARKLTKPL